MPDTRRITFVPAVGGWIAYRTYKAGDSGEMTSNHFGKLEVLVGDLFSIYQEPEAAAEIRKLYLRAEKAENRNDFMFLRPFGIGVLVGAFLLWLVHCG